MAKFIYTAKSLAGQTKDGVQEAVSENELAHLLRDEGFVLTSIRTDSPTDQTKTDSFNFEKIIPFVGHVPLMEKVMFADHLAVMIGAGLSLSRALEAIGSQTKNKKLAEVIGVLNEDIKKGLPLADALIKHPKVFSDLFVNMVKVGETGGNLEEVLKVLADQMKKDHDLHSKVKSAMIYPAVIVSAMLGIGSLMMIFVVPKLAVIFTEMKVTLPLPTRIIIGISNLLANYWFLALGGLIGLFLIARVMAKTKAGREFLGAVTLKAPIFGDIVKKINSARLARTLGSLIKSGVPIVQGLNIVAGTLGNIQFKNSLQKAAQEIQRGQTLSQTLKNYPRLYPAMVNQMIQVGEETGTLDQILMKLAEFYEESVSDITKGLASVIEPLLMILIGAAVGFFAISMLQPMYSIMETL